jgi:hypothetical protein
MNADLADSRGFFEGCCVTLRRIHARGAARAARVCLSSWTDPRESVKSVLIRVGFWGFALQLEAKRRRDRDGCAMNDDPSCRRHPRRTTRRDASRPWSCPGRE